MILLYGWAMIYLWIDLKACNRQWKTIQHLFVEKDYFFYQEKRNLSPFKQRVTTSLIGGALIYLLSYRLDYMIIGGVISYKLYYEYTKSQYKHILKQANQLFPYYLNNLAVFIQQLPVVNALQKSIDYAPELFKEDLEILVDEIYYHPDQLQPYLNFASKFKEIDDLNRIMRTLYNLNKNAGNKEMMITSLSKLTNEKLSTQYKEDLEGKLSSQQVIPYSLFIWLGIVMVVMIASIDIFTS
ncbi:MAG: hypothetical protein R3Y57_03530 [Erysipelotrichaceae bacterium]